MTETDQGQIKQPAQRERTLVDSTTFESYRFVAGQLTESGIGPYLVMEDPQVEQTDPHKVTVVVISPHRRSDAFWEIAHGLAQELRHVTEEKILEVRQNFVAGKIAEIKAEAAVYGRSPYANPKLRNPNQH
ncbi:MAG: hypothetical protein COU25_03530 [Candidatus Levybacteria bacterium CG10_big_fil_rev_8_21_14_0_10_35_13]|nr:MAG: hypothetical protein COU25_03530 [Candidatus Levybacteria bacterium CG10_big_fil_rev_8_21_14_0_10_35_13]